MELLSGDGLGGISEDCEDVLPNEPVFGGHVLLEHAARELPQDEPHGDSGTLHHGFALANGLIHDDTGGDFLHGFGSSKEL